MVVLLFMKNISLKRTNINNVRSVKCKIKHTNKGLGECMAQELTSPLHGWGSNVPTTEWSNHDYNKCTTHRHPHPPTRPEMNKT